MRFHMSPLRMKSLASCVLATGLAYSSQACGIARAQWPPPTPAPRATAPPIHTPGGFDVPATPVPLRNVVSVYVPGGTPIHVSLADPLSSATAQQGDEVAILVTKDVGVDGMLVVKAGASGQATVVDAHGAGGNGSGGKIALSLDYIYSVDGGKIALSAVNHSTDSADSKGAASTATIATYLLLGPLGLFAHNFVRGKDVTIGTDRVFDVFIDHDIHVRSNQTFVVASGYDK